MERFRDRVAATADVEVPLGDVGLPGNLTLPPHPRGVIVFAHGTGSSRLSPPNAAVAKALAEARFGTLLLELIAPEEEGLDLGLSADRVTGAIDWLTCDALAGDLPPRLADLPVGCFGAGTGAAAALVAAADRPDRVVAVVARGGRRFEEPGALERVTALARDWFLRHVG